MEKLVKQFKRTDNEGQVIGTYTALDHIDLQLEPGTFLAILGRNGSGKSTLAKHINALMEPTEGTIWVNGMQTTAEENLLNIRQAVGMVFQNPDNQIVSTVIEEDCAFGPENLGVPEEELVVRVNESLAQVGMTEYAKSAPTKLSGGQKQRVAIAGVLAMKPMAMVLDEATAMLDPSGRREVMETLHRLHRENQATLILITHHMEEAAQADRVIVMDHGKIVMDGTPQEIFRRGEEIEAYGLRLPHSVRLAALLRERGMDIPEDVLDEDDLLRALTT